MKKIIYGGHWTHPPEGWLNIPETEQDLTQPLKQVDESVDVIFTEHVVEHLSLTDCILFFKEAYRVLKHGGVLRTVCPMIDKLVEFQDDHLLSTRHFIRTQLAHYYPAEEAALKELEVDIEHHGKAFLFDSLLKKHNHKFVWTSHLMAEVLTNIGYPSVVALDPGQSLVDPKICIERKIRGIADLNVLMPLSIYDPESIVIEAIK